MNSERAAAANDTLQAIEHELDYGRCGDTCLQCANLRVLAALEQFFDDRCYSSQAACAIARDGKQNRCEKCRKERKL